MSASIFSSIRALSQSHFAGVLIISALVTNACSQMNWDQESLVQRVQARGTLTVLTVSNPLVYSKSKRSEAFGLDYDLLKNFAETYQLELEFKTYPSVPAAQEAFQKGEGHILAARLRAPDYKDRHLPGPALEETHLNLYCQGRLQVDSLRHPDLKTIHISTHDHQDDLETFLKMQNPVLQIKTFSNQSVFSAFKKLTRKPGECLIAESALGDYYLKFFKRIHFVSAMTKDYSLHWWIQNSESDLWSLTQNWYRRASREQTIQNLQERYHTYRTGLSRSDVRYLLANTESILPQYKKIFQSASREYQIPWQLIAAVSYQESLWNPGAVSFTGVRGMMQLTQQTASYLGVDDREDPQQSILGGAKYLRMLYRMQPDDLNHKDRLSLALAAYNIGIAHLRDAQGLARKKGLNPHSWKDLKKVLPKLAEPKYYTQLRYGKARGYETVAFVDRVKSFYNILSFTQR